MGEILAGILIGPSVLGWMAPSELLTALADLGVIFLLSRVGLEVKSSELMSATNPTGWAGRGRARPAPAPCGGTV